MKRPPLYPKYLPEMSVAPRPHQTKAIEDLENAAKKGHRRILCTGTMGLGKSLTMAMIARRAYLKGRKTTILAPMNCVITRSVSKPSQMCGALEQVGLKGHYGVFSGAFPSLRKPNAPVQVVSLQTLLSKSDELHELLSDSDIILIDEGHSASFFKEVEKVYEKWNWKLIVNFTATPFNRGQGIDERHGDLERNTALVQMPSYRESQKLGYLAPLMYHSLDCPVEEKEKLDLVSPGAIEWMLDQWIAKATDKRWAVGFCKPKYQGISQMELVKEIAARKGHRFEIVGDTCKQADYERFMDEYERGETGLLCVQALSTGWDMPMSQHALLFRPIQSRDRYCQIVGRVSRPSPSTGKTCGHVWDFAGNVKLGARGLHPKVEDLSESIDESVLGIKSKGEGEAILKTCVNKSCCGGRPFKMAINLLVCPKCYTQQPRQSIRIVNPSTGQILSSMSELMALTSRENSIAYFRQQRKIAYANGWNPFAAHMQCKQLGIEIKLDDLEFWRGSIFEAPEDESLADAYRKYLRGIAPRLNERAANPWDDRKIESEVAREFAVKSLAWS